MPSPIVVHPACDAHWFSRNNRRWRERNARVSGPAQVSCTTDDALKLNVCTEKTKTIQRVLPPADLYNLHSLAFRNAPLSLMAGVLAKCLWLELQISVGEVTTMSCGLTVKPRVGLSNVAFQESHFLSNCQWARSLDGQHLSQWQTARGSTRAAAERRHRHRHVC